MDVHDAGCSLCDCAHVCACNCMRICDLTSVLKSLHIFLKVDRFHAGRLTCANPPVVNEFGSNLHVGF